ncbi:MAG: FGGY-family carbohydrate kinase [Thermomicrobiales bacterium]|nr:FGGY-family carbohydrate kinase [Thermomicrobiales bacterium]
MSETQLIGVDIGTTGVKAALIDNQGALLCDHTVPHDLHSPHAGWAEEDPADWIAGAEAALRGVSAHPAFDAASLAGIGVSGMVPAMVMLDGEGRPVRPSIQQNDARAFAEADELRQEIDQDSLFARTGGFTNQQHIAPRLRWVQRHEPDAWTKTTTLLGSYDFVTAHLTGKPPANCSLEINWAIESGLFDLHTGRWAPDLMAAVDLDEGYFPPVRQPVEIVGETTQEIAARTGLPAGIPVVAGSADHVASAFAAGLRDDGDTLIKFGGAGDILYCSSNLITDPRLFIDAHDIPGMYLLNGCMAASGSLVKWLVQDILGREPNKANLMALDAEALAIPAGSDGVIVLPYFLGEKTPILDPHARGVIFGLDLSHRPAHLFRAVLEAVIYGFRHHVDVLESAGHHPRRYLATNGGVSSPIWRQIAADVLGADVTSFQGHPGSSLGVAFVAGMATGAFDAWSDIDRFLQNRVVNEPNPSHRAIYDQRYATYRELYERLRDLFPRG